MTLLAYNPTTDSSVQDGGSTYSIDIWVKENRGRLPLELLHAFEEFWINQRVAPLYNSSSTWNYAFHIWSTAR